MSLFLVHLKFFVHFKYRHEYRIQFFYLSDARLIRLEGAIISWLEFRAGIENFSRSAQESTPMNRFRQPMLPGGPA